MGVLFSSLGNTNRGTPKLDTHCCLTELPFVSMGFRCYISPNGVYMSSAGFWTELEMERKDSGERDNKVEELGWVWEGLLAALCFLSTQSGARGLCFVLDSSLI